MDLSEHQHLAVQHAQSIISDAGLSASDLDYSPTTSTRSLTPTTLNMSPAASSVAPLPSTEPSPIQTTVDAIVEHPLRAIVEYPETGSVMGQAIAHIFSISANYITHKFDNPRASFQYSFGDGHGGWKNVLCHLLQDSTDGKPVKCNRILTSCKGLKACSSNTDAFINATHSYTHQAHVSELITPTRAFSPADDSAECEVFTKTFAFFCALKNDLNDLNIDPNDYECALVTPTAVSSHSPSLVWATLSCALMNTINNLSNVNIIHTLTGHISSFGTFKNSISTIFKHCSPTTLQQLLFMKNVWSVVVMDPCVIYQ
ncbi:hypothetical protein BDR03DRAFT_1018040 [Suillus americanus]|nr:hypothetical protein BDR03DRAFT_1018040 [Suillus americanus]